MQQEDADRMMKEGLEEVHKEVTVGSDLLEASRYVAFAETSRAPTSCSTKLPWSYRRLWHR
jgi:hypothetical protein